MLLVLFLALNFPVGVNGAQAEALRRSVFHLPHHGFARGTSPENIRRLIPVVISDCGDGPLRPDVNISEVDIFFEDPIFHLPDRRVTIGAAPNEIAGSIAVKVADTSDTPVALYEAKIDVSLQCAAFQQPDRSATTTASPK